MEGVLDQLRRDFDGRAQDVKADIADYGGTRLVQHVCIPSLPQLGGSAHATISNGHINLAAVVGVRLPKGDCDQGDQEGSSRPALLVAGGLEAEAYRCCQVLEVVLQCCGGAWGDMVRLTAYVADLTDESVEVLEQVVDSFFAERGCPSVARTIVGCAKLRLQASVQLEATAVTQTGFVGSMADSPDLPSRVPSNSILEDGDCSPAATPRGPPPGLQTTPPVGSHRPSDTSTIEGVVFDKRPSLASASSETWSSPPRVAEDGCSEVTLQPELASADVVEFGAKNGVKEPVGASSREEHVPRRGRGSGQEADSLHGTQLNRAAARFVPTPYSGRPSGPTSLAVTPLRIQDVPVQEVKGLVINGTTLEFQAHHDCFSRLAMAGNESFRTARLCPSRITCQQIPEAAISWSQRVAGAHQKIASTTTWSYSFDVALVQTLNSFLNVGLVEQIGFVKVDENGHVPEYPRASLASVMRVDSRGGSGPALEEVTKEPRQMMLGCRKGVKWYGDNKTEPLFKDDLCDGSTLRFRVEHVTDESGSITLVRLWLLPSVVNFRWGGKKTVHLQGPLFEHVVHDDAANGHRKQPGYRTFWVPAVTVFSRGDRVAFAWQGVAEGSTPPVAENAKPHVVAERSATPQATESEKPRAPAKQRSTAKASTKSSAKAQPASTEEVATR